MSETRWTPRPWRWWTSNSRLRLSSDATGKDGDVLYAERLHDGADVVVSNPADRPLIAAAPDLYAALEALTIATERWNEAVETVIGRNPLPEGHVDAVAMARAALSKARGEDRDA